MTSGTSWSTGQIEVDAEEAALGSSAEAEGDLKVNEPLQQRASWLRGRPPCPWSGPEQCRTLPAWMHRGDTCWSWPASGSASKVSAWGSCHRRRCPPPGSRPGTARPSDQCKALPAIGTTVIIRFQLGLPHVQNHLAKPPRGYLSGFTKFNMYNTWLRSSGVT